MNTSPTILSFSLLAVMASSCTPVWERQARHLRQEVHNRPLVIQAHTTRWSDAASQTLPDLVDIRSLDELLTWGIERHPAMQARLATVRRASARTDAAGALPSPRIGLTPLGEMAQTASGEVTLMASISQHIPAPGSLSAQVASNAAEVRSAEAHAQQEAATIAYRIRRAWWQKSYAEAGSTITNEQLALLQQVRDAMLARVQAGTGKQSDILRIGIEIERVKTMQHSWQERLHNALAELRTALSITAETPLPALLNTGATQYKVGQLVALARIHRGDVLRNQAHRQKAEALAAAAAARRRPDFTTSLSYNMVDDENLMGPTSGDDQWWFGVSMSVPLWFGSYAASDREAAAAKQEARFEAEAIDNRIQRDIATAMSTWHSTRAQIALYDDGLLAQAQAAFDAENSHYSNGSSSYTDVIATWKQVLSLHLSYHALKRDVGLAEADLLHAAGVILVAQLVD